MIQEIDENTSPLQEQQQAFRRIRTSKFLVYPLSDRQLTTEGNGALQEYTPNIMDKTVATSVNDIAKEELDSYRHSWHWDCFLEFLIYHLLFYIFFGPFMVCIFFKWPGVPLMKNMKFYCQHHVQFYTQLLLWMGSVFGGLVYFLSDDSIISLTEVIFMWGALIMRAVVISAKYATLGYPRIKLYKLKELPSEMFQFDLMFFDWYYQTPKVKFLHQYRAMRRHEFEPSIYKFDFLLPPLDDTRKQLLSTEICFYFEWVVKQQLQQTDAFQEDMYYNGFHIFGYFVDAFQKLYPPTAFQKYIWFLSISLSLTPVFIRLNRFYEEHPPSVFDIARLIINILTSIQAFYGSFIFLAIGIYDFKRKFFLLDQCLYLLQAKKVKYSDKKLLPTINFNNPITLQAWSMMRSISFDYGQCFNLRTQGFYSINFLANITFIFIALGEILELIQLSTFQLILLGEMALVMFGFMGYYLYMGAKLNEYFDKFETLLDDVKSIYLDILRMRENYFQNNVEPINDVHKIFVNLLKGHVKIEEIQEDLDIIIKEVDDNLRHLNYDKRTNPFTLYGVTITYNLLKSLVVGLGTIFSYAVQQRLMATTN